MAAVRSAGRRSIFSQTDMIAILPNLFSGEMAILEYSASRAATLLSSALATKLRRLSAAVAAGATGGNQNRTTAYALSTARLCLPKDRGPGQDEIMSSGHPKRKNGMRMGPGGRFHLRAASEIPRD